MELVWEWGLGNEFIDVVELSEELEGGVVRALSRLNELVKEVIMVAGVVGDVGLREKMRNAKSLVERGIVFLGSLYY